MENTQINEEDIQKEVDRCRRDILHSTFFDHDKIRENVKDPEKLGKYIMSELIGEHGSEGAVSKTLKLMTDILGNKIIYSAVSFYDHYRLDWLEDFYRFPKTDDKSNLLQFLASNTFFPLTSFLIEGQDGYSKTCKLRHWSLNGGSDSIGHHEYICKQCKFNQDMKNIATITNNGTSATVNLSRLDNAAFSEYIKNYQVKLEKRNLQKAFGIDIDRLKEEENGEDKIRRIENLFKFLFAQKESNNWKFLYCFTPTYKFPGGVIFIYMRDRLNDNFVDLIQLLANQLFFQLAVALNVVRAEENLKKHGTRAAAASIIGRNMSHNIGSHVIYYLSSSFQNSDRNPFNKILEEFIEKCKEKTNPDFQQILKDFNKKEDNDKVNIFERFYNDMSTFLNYIQARMDYVALAGTIEPGYGQGMKIKDLMEEFKDNTFLIDGIAASEGVKRIDIKPRDDGNSFNGLVTIPFGEIGKHAFFSILENIIRNSAKHGHDKITDGKLSLYYSVTKNNNNGMIDLEIYDELNTWKEAEHAMHLSKEDNKQSAIESPLIDINGSLVYAYMGIKEMKISAAFLRMIPFYEIDSKKHKKGNLLKLVPHNDSLMYKIRLLPYKNLLIVTEGDKGLSSVNEDYGIDKAGIEYLKKENQHIDEYKIAVSNFPVDKLEEETKNKLPNRLMYCKDISNKSFHDANTIFSVYKKWIEITYSIKDLDDKKIYYHPSLTSKEDIKELKTKWNGILYVDECLDSCCVRFQGHLEEFLDYVDAYDQKMHDDFEIAEDISKRSHILKERLNDTSYEKDFEKQLLRLELLESAFSRVLIIDERLFSEYQCYCHDFVVDGKKYRISCSDGGSILSDQGDERKIFHFPSNEFNKIGRWLYTKKALGKISFYLDSKKLVFTDETDPIVLNNGVSEIIKSCIEHISLQKLVENIKFLYEKRHDFYRFYVKNIEICNNLTTKENNEITFVNLKGKPLFSIKKDDNGKPSLDWTDGQTEFHFLSLHLGIIDKIRKTLSYSESDIIRAFDSSLKKTYFILHTGRGKTLQTKDKDKNKDKNYPVRFMDFTTLNNLVNGSKWMFVQGLYSIKKQIYE